MVVLEIEFLHSFFIVRLCLRCLSLRRCLCDLKATLKKFKFIAPLAAVALSVGFLLFPRAPEKTTAPFVKAPDSGAVFSNYHLPPLAGWDGRVREDADSPVRSVTYNHRVAGSRLQMKFVLYETAQGEEAKGLTQLRAIVEQGLQNAKKSSPTSQKVEQSETTFRTFPAIVTRTRDEKNGGVRERKILRVADGKNTFSFDQTLAGPSISPIARAEADRAWQKFCDQLKIEN